MRVATLPTPGLDSIDISTATSDGWSACLSQTVVHTVAGVQVSRMLEKIFGSKRLSCNAGH